MIAVIAISTFLCIALVVMSVHWMTQRQTSTVNARLDKIDPSVVVEEESSVAALAEMLAEPISRLAPPSAAEAKKLQTQMLQAGFRSPDAATVFRACQLVAMMVFPTAVLSVCFLQQRPLSTTFIWGFFALALGFYLPRYVLRRMINSRKRRITWGLPDALDLLVVTIEAGLGLNAALARVGAALKKVHPEVHKEFELVDLEIRVGRGREEALRNLADRTGVDELRSFVAMLVQADRFGTSIGHSVRVFADSLRTKRRQRAEQGSQKAALKLLFPLVLLLFPTLFIVILGPTVLNLLDIMGRH